MRKRGDDIYFLYQQQHHHWRRLPRQTRVCRPVIERADRKRRRQSCSLLRSPRMSVSKWSPCRADRALAFLLASPGAEAPEVRGHANESMPWIHHWLIDLDSLQYLSSLAPQCRDPSASHAVAASALRGAGFLLGRATLLHVL